MERDEKIEKQVLISVTRRSIEIGAAAAPESVVLGQNPGRDAVAITSSLASE